MRQEHRHSWGSWSRHHRGTLTCFIPSIHRPPSILSVTVDQAGWRKASDCQNGGKILCLKLVGLDEKRFIDLQNWCNRLFVEGSDKTLWGEIVIDVTPGEAGRKQVNISPEGRDWKRRPWRSPADDHGLKVTVQPLFKETPHQQIRHTEVVPTSTPLENDHLRFQTPFSFQACFLWC